MARLASFARALVLAPCLLAAACSSSGDEAAAGDESDLTSAPTPSQRRSLEGYECPESDSKAAKVLFLDADTVRVSKANSVTATSETDVDILPFAAWKIRQYRRDGYLVAIISNQGGVASGKTKYEVAEGAIHFTAEQLTKLGARVDYWDFAEAKDENRKPSTGMGEKLESALRDKCDLAIDREASLMVGDSAYKRDVDGPSPDGREADDFSNSDRFFAENFGIPFAEPTDAFGWREFGVYNVLGEKQLLEFYATLDAAAAEAHASGDDGKGYWLDWVLRRGREINGLQVPPSEA